MRAVRTMPGLLLQGVASLNCSAHHLKLWRVLWKVRSVDGWHFPGDSRGRRSPTNRLDQWATICFIVLIALVQTNCTGCIPTKQTVPADVSVKIDDPAFQRLAAITKRLELEAEGRMQKGRYSVKGIALEVPRDTTFQLSLVLPVESATSISTGKATGVFTTSKSMRLGGVEMPTSVSIDGGKATAEVDLGRTIAAFLLQLLQEKSSVTATSKLKDILESLLIKKANFVLKPGEKLDLETLKGKIQGDSQVTFESIKCDSKLNYEGFCKIDLSLEDFLFVTPGEGGQDARALAEHGERPAGRTPDGTRGTPDNTRVPSGSVRGALFVQSKSARIATTFNTRRQGDTLTFLWREGDNSTSSDNQANRAPAIALRDFMCIARNGSVAGSQASLQLLRSTITKRINAAPIDLDLQGSVQIEHGVLKTATSERTLQAKLPDATSALFKLNRTEKANVWSIATANAVHGSDIKWQIKKREGTIELNFADAKTGPVTIASNEGLSVTLMKGTAVPSKFSWSSRGRHVRAMLTNSTLALESDVHFALEDTGEARVETLPLSINAKSVELNNGKQNLTLKAVQGKALFKIAGDSIDLHSHLAFSVDPGAMFAGLSGVPLTIDSVDCTASKISMKASFNGCQLKLPCSKIEAAIKKELPRHKSFEVHKSVLDERKWRYRNLIINSVDIDNPSITKIDFRPDSIIQVAGATDIKAEGTVERLKLLPFGGAEKRGWNQHPWSASGHVIGSGNVIYKVVPGKSLADSSLNYDLSLKLQVPDNLSVDWSKVAGDVLGRTEQALVGAVIKHASLFTPEEGIPVNTSGTIPLIPEPDAQLRKIRLSNFSTRTSKDCLYVVFSAAAEL